MEHNRTSSPQSRQSILPAFVIMSSAVFTGGVNAAALKQSDEDFVLHGFKLSAPFPNTPNRFAPHLSFILTGELRVVFAPRTMGLA